MSSSKSSSTGPSPPGSEPGSGQPSASWKKSNLQGRGRTGRSCRECHLDPHPSRGSRRRPEPVDVLGRRSRMHPAGSRIPSLSLSGSGQPSVSWKPSTSSAGVVALVNRVEYPIVVGVRFRDIRRCPEAIMSSGTLSIDRDRRGFRRRRCRDRDIRRRPGSHRRPRRRLSISGRRDRGHRRSHCRDRDNRRRPRTRRDPRRPVALIRRVEDAITVVVRVGTAILVLNPVSIFGSVMHSSGPSRIPSASLSGSGQPSSSSKPSKSSASLSQSSVASGIVSPSLSPSGQPSASWNPSMSSATRSQSSVVSGTPSESASVSGHPSAS